LIVSIHSLRKKGDTEAPAGLDMLRHVSIHSLRKKGDEEAGERLGIFDVSIHSLRKKGDIVRSEVYD